MPLEPDEIGWIAALWAALGGAAVWVSRFGRSIWCASKFASEYSERLGSVEQALVEINDWRKDEALTRSGHAAEANLQWERFRRENDQKLNELWKDQYHDFRELKQIVKVAAEHSENVDRRLEELREMVMALLQREVSK